MKVGARSFGFSRAAWIGSAIAALMLARTLAGSCDAASAPPRSAGSAKPAPGVARSTATVPRTAAPPVPTRLAPPDSARVMALLAGAANATCPLPGVASAGQVGAGHLSGLARAGFRTVLDLRAPDEPRGYDEAASVAGAGLDYVTIPVTGRTLDDATFDHVRAFMGDARHHPVLVHCASGNRVGVVLLPWLVLDRGWSVTDAVAVAEQGGMRASPLRDRALGYIDRMRAKR